MKNKRLIFLAVMIALVLSLAASPASAESSDETEVSDITEETSSAPLVRVNGFLVTFPDAQPFIDSNSRTLIPVRAATEALGATVSWNAETRTASISKNDITVQIPIDSKILTVTDSNGTKSTVTMDTAAIISEDRTYVPIRFVAEALGAWVGYSDYYNTVQIYQDQLTPEEIDRLHGYYDMGYKETLVSKGTYEKTVALGYDVDGDDVLYKNIYSQYYGTYGINNENEEVFYRASSLVCKTEEFQDYVTNEWYYPTVNTDEEYANRYVANASDVILHSILYNYIYNTPSANVTVTFKTDASCVYHSRCQDAIWVKGVCTITFGSNCDTSKLAASIKCGAFPFTPVAGQTYTFDAAFPVYYSCGNLWTPKLIDLETQKRVQLS